MLTQITVACDYALHRLASIAGQCPDEPIIFTAYSSSPDAAHLPLTFVGQGLDYTPSSRIWCVLLVLWQPRPVSRPPPPTLADLFPFSRLLQTAEEIKDVCWGSSPGAVPLPTIGRAWVLPNQWVDVQFGVVFGPPSLEKANVASEEVQRSKMRVLLADGSHKTLNTPAINFLNATCGGSTGHVGGQDM